MTVVAVSASCPAALRARELDDEDVAFDAAFGAASRPDDGERSPSVAVTESYQRGADAPSADHDSRDAVKPRPPNVAKPERVDTTPLEGIRTVACAIIAANHWLAWYGRKKHGSIELQGGFAVTVFFFITGFVMYLAYGDKVCREDFKYWVRAPEPRRARVAPPRDPAVPTFPEKAFIRPRRKMRRRRLAHGRERWRLDHPTTRRTDRRRATPDPHPRSILTPPDPPPSSPRRTS